MSAVPVPPAQNYFKFMREARSYRLFMDGMPLKIRS